MQTSSRSCSSLYLQAFCYTCAMPDYSNFQHFLTRLKKLVYAMILLLFLLLFVLELKHYYNINLFPGVDGPLDNIYFKLKEAF